MQLDKLQEYLHLTIMPRAFCQVYIDIKINFMASTVTEFQSVGLVTPRTVEIKEPLALRCGKELPSYKLVYETYGTLNKERSNAILICHALSGNHHAAGYDKDNKLGWWDSLIGPNKAVDTNHYYVVALNNLGGCHGSTGPCSINPLTNKEYGADFPLLTVEDWVASQFKLREKLGIDCWAAIMGGSLGGMQAFRWAIDYPNHTKAALLIACAAKLSAQNIAFNQAARQAILKDSDFHHGNYRKKNTYPKRGLMLARMIGHITYLSESGMVEKFGRQRLSEKLGFSYEQEFQVESYLNHQGDKFSDSFDANTYLLITRALDYFDPAAEHQGDLVKAFLPATCSFLVLSFTTDWRFPSPMSREMVNALIKGNKKVSYAEIEASHGHDAFLMPIDRYIQTVRTFLSRLAEEI